MPDIDIEASAEQWILGYEDLEYKAFMITANMDRASGAWALKDLADQYLFDVVAVDSVDYGILYDLLKTSLED